MSGYFVHNSNFFISFVGFVRAAISRISFYKWSTANAHTHTHVHSHSSTSSNVTFALCSSEALLCAAFWAQQWRTQAKRN